VFKPRRRLFFQESCGLLVPYLRAWSKVPHGLYTPTFLAFVLTPSSWVVFPGIHFQFVLGAHHAPFTIPVLRHTRLPLRNFIIYKAERRHGQTKDYDGGREHRKDEG
jgi:hypothetical protein